MSKMGKMQSVLSEKVVPFMEKLGQAKVLQALSSGMMMTLPLTLGGAIFSLLGSFPISSVADFFSKTGLSDQFNAVSNGTIGVLAVLTSVTIAYNYAVLMGIRAITPALFSLGAFLILLPQQIPAGDEVISGYLSSNLGSSGLFVSMILAILIPLIYSKLIKNKRLVLKLPESVPPMVSQSFKPIFIGMILLFFVMIIRFGFSLTSFGDIFSFVNQIVAKPLMSVGASVPSLFLIYILANVLFFFGIHPNAIMSVLVPVVMPMLVAATEQFQQGQAIEYLENLVVFDFMNNDGTGSTLSLMICVLLFGKSQRYKSFAKIGTIPNIFNINEPVIFGFPIMLNPIMFIPFVLSTLLSGATGFLALKIGFISQYNPIMVLGVPWTVPKFIGAFFTMGWQGVVVRLFIMVMMIFLYYPFFKVLDRKELENEIKLANEEN